MGFKPRILPLLLSLCICSQDALLAAWSRLSPDTSAPIVLVRLNQEALAPALSSQRTLNHLAQLIVVGILSSHVTSDSGFVGAMLLSGSLLSQLPPQDEDVPARWKKLITNVLESRSHNPTEALSEMNVLLKTMVGIPHGLPHHFSVADLPLPENDVLGDIGDHLRHEWHRLGLEDSLGHINIPIALLTDSLREPLPLLYAAHERLRLLKGGTLEQQLLAVFTDGVMQSRHIREFGMHFYKHGYAGDNEFLVQAIREFIPLLLSWPKDKESYWAMPTPGTTERYRFRDLMLWGLADMLDPRLYDNSILYYEYEEQETAKGYGNASDSILWHLTRALTNLDLREVGEDGQKTDRRIDEKHLHALLKEINKTKAQWEALGLRPPGVDRDGSNDSLTMRMGLLRTQGRHWPLRDIVLNTAVQSTEIPSTLDGYVSYNYRRYIEKHGSLTEAMPKFLSQVPALKPGVRFLSTRAYQRDTPAWELLDALGLQDFEALPGEDIPPAQFNQSETSFPLGARIKRIRTPRSLDPNKLAQGLGILPQELGQSEFFDLLINEYGHLIAIFPVSENAEKGTHEYFDISPYFFAFHPLGTPGMKEKWEEFQVRHAHDQKTIQTYRTLLAPGVEEFTQPIYGTDVEVQSNKESIFALYFLKKSNSKAPLALFHDFYVRHFSPGFATFMAFLVSPMWETYVFWTFLPGWLQRHGDISVVSSLAISGLLLLALHPLVKRLTTGELEGWKPTLMRMPALLALFVIYQSIYVWLLPVDGATPHGAAFIYTAFAHSAWNILCGPNWPLLSLIGPSTAFIVYTLKNFIGQDEHRSIAQVLRRIKNPQDQKALRILDRTLNQTLKDIPERLALLKKDWITLGETLWTTEMTRRPPVSLSPRLRRPRVYVEELLAIFHITTNKATDPDTWPSWRRIASSFAELLVHDYGHSATQIWNRGLVADPLEKQKLEDRRKILTTLYGFNAPEGAPEWETFVDIEEDLKAEAYRFALPRQKSFVSSLSAQILTRWRDESPAHLFYAKTNRPYGPVVLTLIRDIIAAEFSAAPKEAAALETQLIAPLQTTSPMTYRYYHDFKEYFQRYVSQWVYQPGWENRVVYPAYRIVLDVGRGAKAVQAAS